MIFISVVSHGHCKLIQDIGALADLSKSKLIKIIVKDNKGEPELEDYCLENNLTYIASLKSAGFGENNNLIFTYIKHLVQDDDYFIIMNPDVFVDEKTIIETIKIAEEYSAELVTINLFRDENKKIYDNSIRHFPKFADFVSSLVLKKNKCIIDKNIISEPTYVDWAAGSFLIFKANLYSAIGGFNERYFMYCEDIDICWRVLEKKGVRVLYVPNATAVHYAQFSNRNIFSRHFYWHLKSIFLFFLYRHKIIRLRNNYL